MIHLIQEMLLIRTAVLQEDVRHCLRLSHPASQVEVRRQRSDHLQATDPAVAPIVNPGTRGWCCSAADQPRQVLGIQQGMMTFRQLPLSPQIMTHHWIAHGQRSCTPIQTTTIIKMSSKLCTNRTCPTGPIRQADRVLRRQRRKRNPQQHLLQTLQTS
jgi:hypothetical protein